MSATDTLLLEDDFRSNTQHPVEVTVVLCTVLRARIQTSVLHWQAAGLDAKRTLANRAAAQPQTSLQLPPATAVFRGERGQGLRPLKLDQFMDACHRDSRTASPLSQLPSSALAAVAAGTEHQPGPLFSSTPTVLPCEVVDWTFCRFIFSFPRSHGSLVIEACLFSTLVNPPFYDQPFRGCRRCRAVSKHALSPSRTYQSAKLYIDSDCFDIPTESPTMARSASSKPPAVRASPPPQAANSAPKPKSKTVKRKEDYSSEGVEDNDVFLLPGFDFQLILGITALAAAVRLFRIYQPTSVVFDEVQYVTTTPPWLPRSLLQWLGLTVPSRQLRRLCLQVHQGPVLHGRTSSTGEAVDYPLRLARWLRRQLRFQGHWQGLPRARRALCGHALVPGNLWHSACPDHVLDPQGRRLPHLHCRHGRWSRHFRFV